MSDCPTIATLAETIMTVSRTCLHVLSLLTIGLGNEAIAAPVPAGAQQTTTVMRRTALIVRDMDASLHLYRDALALVVVDDRSTRSPANAKTDEEANSITRIVLLRGNDDNVGQLELIHFVKPVHTPLPLVTDDERHPGSFVMLFSAKDVAATFKAAAAVPGVRTMQGLHAVTYRAFGSSKMVTEVFTKLYDPDGNFIEINQQASSPSP
jgi:catechol 2,3-dioxygenase-like lactoylglutathione lyase family enzyme